VILIVRRYVGPFEPEAPLMLRTLITFALLCQPPLAATFGVSGDPDTPTESIRLCQIKLTDAGRSSTFRFAYVYQVETGKDGAVDDVKEIRSDADDQLVDVTQITACIRTWKLRPHTRYLVTISVGTTGDNFMVLHNLDERRVLRVDFT